MIDARDWRTELYERWGVRTLQEFHPQLQSALWTTRCSKTKPVASGTPEELYLSSSNLFFYKFARSARVRYGIISDMYGIHFDDEQLPYYDVHPGELTENDKRKLGDLVRQRATARGYSEIAFYNASPLMSTPYFQILAFSGLSIYYTTRLPLAFS